MSLHPYIVRSCRSCGLGEECFVVIKRSDHQVIRRVVGGVVRGATPQASVLACVCSCGNK